MICDFRMSRPVKEVPARKARSKASSKLPASSIKNATGAQPTKVAADEEKQIEASPTKRFFVEMLTRDIDLIDAILDLLDNCIDGVLRISRTKAQEHRSGGGYKDRWAAITLNPKKFAIKDNCGGIELSVAENYAFMMGRPKNDADSNIPTVGMYGIGMKRAIFKMGRSATVRTQTAKDSYEVEIPNTWFNQEGNWKLPLRMILPLDHEQGTQVEITRILPEIARQFESKDFVETLKGRIATHFSYVLNKGFSVTVNGQQIKPRPLHLLVDSSIKSPKSKGEGIAPYMYEGELDGVQIRLFAGLSEPLSTADEEEEGLETRRSREDAGWTVICNDRVIVYCNKDRLTGWGEATVPMFHPQFNQISGIVEFRSNDAFKLPVTTTKRGIDAGSEIFLYVKEFMREGTKIFTSYTNKWKAKAEEGRRRTKSAKALPLERLSDEVPKEKWDEVKKKLGKAETKAQRKFVPNLPLPSGAHEDERFMRFSRPISEIRRVSMFLFEDPERPPSEVAETCFSRILAQVEARKR